jgi:hypothetical protein
MSKRARIDRLAHAQASASAAVQPVSIEVPDIITFVTSPQFLNRPKLYPRQALVLKVMFVALELLTPYDYAVLAKWGAGFRPVGETGDRRYQGTEGLPPDVLARMAACRASGRRWFRETVLVIGRRGSKGHLSALAAAYVLWTYLALENPQGHYGIERTKRLTGMIFAGERSQATDNLFSDLAGIISTAPCFAPYLAASTKHVLRICTPRDLHENGRRPARELAAVASVVIDARPSTGLAGRGPAAFMIVFDELAHLGVDTARSADQVYEAAVPALDQFGVDAMIVQASSPASQLGRFYRSYQAALALDDDDNAKDPSMLTLQLPSWALYEDWELTNQSGGLPMFPGGPTFSPLDKPLVCYDEAMRRAEAANPAVFAVERRAQWRTSIDAFLDADLVAPIFTGLYNGEQLTTQQFGRLGTEYVMHVDAAQNRANFAIVIAHAGQRDDRGLPHVVIDAIHVRRPADFPDGRIDQLHCLRLIQDLIAAFAPATVTFDQYQGALSVGLLRAWCAEQSLPRQPRIYQQDATGQRNREVADTFKSAVRLGLVHAPPHELARLELLHLQERNGRVEHPSHGPVQTSDVSDALFEVTHRIIGDDLDRWHQLAALPLGMSLSGGIPIPSQPPAANPMPQFPRPSGGLSIARGRPGRGMPERGRRWR